MQFDEFCNIYQRTQQLGPETAALTWTKYEVAKAFGAQVNGSKQVGCPDQQHLQYIVTIHTCYIRLITCKC